MKKYLPLFAMSAALIFGGCHKKENTTQETPEVQVAYPMVDSVTLHKTYPGYIRANNSGEIVARVNGVLLAQYYHEGDYVQKGQLLFTIDPSKYQDALQQAQASLKTAQSQYDYYSRQYEAMKKALEADAVSQMEVIQSESNMNQAKASIQNAKAAVASAAESLGYCTIHAQRSGRISMASTSTGNYINGEGSPVKLATIFDDSDVKAVFAIEDAQYELMMNESKVDRRKLLSKIPLRFQQSLPHAYYADLTYTSPNIETSTGTLALEGILSNKYGELKDGMFVSVDLPYGTDPKAVLIQDAAIGTDQLGKYIYVVNDSNKVEYRSIEVGETYQDTLRIVKKGISPEEKYITKAMLTVRNGETVKPVSVNKPKK